MIFKIRLNNLNGWKITNRNLLEILCCKVDYLIKMNYLIAKFHYDKTKFIKHKRSNLFHKKINL